MFSRNNYAEVLDSFKPLLTTCNLLICTYVTAAELNLKEYDISNVSCNFRSYNIRKIDG